jgi:tetratricopeptide (TPR) repeat protein
MVRLTSFLSTSLDRRLALGFLPPASSVTNSHVRVLIEINLNGKFNSKPFGNISHLSEFSGENEVLMMIGTFLRVRQTYYNDEEKMVESIMTLENDYILPFENRHMSLKECVSIIAAKVCKEAPEEEINTIFDELDELFASEREWLRAERYRALGGCQKGYRRENYRSALQYYKQALATWQRHPKDSGVEIGNLNLEIGRLYNYHLEEDQLAQEHYQSAITVCKTTLSHLQDDERQKAALYKTLSMVYLDKAEMNDQNEEQKTVLHYEQLRLQALLKVCSPTNRELSLCYTSIAELQEQMGLFDEALRNYKETTKVYIAQNDTEALSGTYQRISRIYEDNLQDLSSALKYRLLKHDAMVQSKEILPFHDCQEIEDTKHCVVQSHIQLANIHLKLRDFKAARLSLAAAKQLYEDMDWQKQAKNIEEQLSDIDRLERNSK